MPGAYGDPKKVSDTLEMELQMAMSQKMNQGPLQEHIGLLNTELSLQPLNW